MTTSNRPQLIVSPGRDKALGRRHPWIFSGAIRRVVGSPADGDIVDVVSHDGQWLATGFYQRDTIVCKVLSYDTPQVDDLFFRQLLSNAIAYRERFGFFSMKDTNVFRLVNGEGDYLPGLIADFYNGVVVLQAHSVGMHRRLSLLVEMFKALLGDRLVALFDKSYVTLPEGCKSVDGYLWQSQVMPDEWEVVEHGNRMMINFFEGQKTGFFVDQRENRHLVASLSQGKRLLNCFGYTGGFSLAALRGGASYVETVDISRKAVDLCNRNVQLNFGDNAPHQGVVADVLHYLDEVDNMFDVIILDPPAFAKSHNALQHGLKGYRSINTKALQRIRPGGLLLTFSCSQAVSRDDFQTMAFSAAALAHRQVRIVRTLPHALDHPVSIYHPEGEYLKGLLLYVE